MESYLQQQQNPSFQGVIYGVFQKPQVSTRPQRISIALVAAHAAAGTTYMTRMLADMLNTEANPPAIAVGYQELVHMSEYADRDNRSGLSSALVPPRGTWRSSSAYRANYLAKLKEHYSAVLVDCPSLKESQDVLALAPLVDGVFLVVEANKTTKRQIAFLERTIQAAGGNCLGYLLNKRTYPIPDWAYKALGF